MKKLENCIHLSHKVKIYVPSTIDINLPCDNEKILKDTLTKISSYFGGATSYPAFGAWITAGGQLVQEKITICESYCIESDLEAHISSIYDLCKDIKALMKQEAIAL